jgi:myo-inositol 2-dehydrogenase/D-chiro-inositol 1-dehydrogenase
MSQCRHIDGAWAQVSEFAHGVNGHCNVSGGAFFDRSGKRTDMVRKQGENAYVQEHIDLQKSIREGKPLQEGELGAEATMTAILGRVASYSGKAIKWDDAINSDISLMPEAYAFDANPPVMPDDQGRYPVPVPGVSNGWTA